MGHLAVLREVSQHDIRRKFGRDDLSKKINQSLWVQLILDPSPNGINVQYGIKHYSKRCNCLRRFPFAPGQVMYKGIGPVNGSLSLWRKKKKQVSCCIQEAPQEPPSPSSAENINYVIFVELKGI